MHYFVILLSFLMVGTALKADSSSSSRIAAVVNNTVITKADLMNRLRFAAISSGLEPTSENLDRVKDQILRIMIDEALQLQIGKKYGIEIKKDHLQAAIKDIEESNGMPEGAITRMMEANGIPFSTFEDQIRAQLTWLVYIREKYPLKSLEIKQQDGLPSLQIADWEIDQEIKLQKNKETKTQYHLAEIVLPFDSSDQEAEIKQNLNNLTEELKKGAHFGALAQQFSQSATSAQGGDMGWLTEDQLEPEIKEALSHLQPGQLSAPIRTSQNYNLIAFIERKLPGTGESTLLTMQQVLLPFPNNVTEDKAREIMKLAEDLSHSAKNCKDLEKMSLERFPSASLHLTRNELLSTFPEALQEVLLKLDINQGSEPLLTQEGGLIVMLCDKKSQKDPEFTREDAESLITSRKHALIARRELRDLKRHAFIDLRM
ncbi:MAG: peptidylprolyl isomerase [Proteobacteria bacterium]|nr:peptidylprolyl isomerase [Pseudomonadota bacterium]